MWTNKIKRRNPEKAAFDRLNEMMNNELLFTLSDLKQQDIAKKIGMNEKTLSSCIKSNTGMIYPAYINHLRLDYSKKVLLSDENYTIEAVAAKTGFTRSNYYRLFKEKYSVSPDEYRKGEFSVPLITHSQHDIKNPFSVTFYPFTFIKRCVSFFTKIED